MFKTMLKILLIAVAFSMIIAGCSRNSSNPITTQNPMLDMPTIDYMTEGENHEPLGAWTARFDLDSMTASVEPNREMSLRLNVRPYLPNPVITTNSWDPVDQTINVDMSIKNVYNVHAFDVRLIIFTDNIGHTLTNPDDWTSLYDIPGGLNINPFKAYAKDATNRIFAAYSQHTANLNIKLPGGNPFVKFAIDASSPGNCVEPYDISGFTHEPFLSELNATASASFTVSRWNPTAAVSAWIQCPAVFGATIIGMTTSDNYHFEGDIVNYNGAQYGEYLATIIAKTNLSSLFLYDIVTIYVQNNPGTGWAKQFDDSMVWTMTVDSSGNIYAAGSELGNLMKYDDDGVQLWSRDIKTEDSYAYINNLSFNEYIRVCGMYQFCTTNVGYIAGMYGASNTRNWGKYDCMYPIGASGLAIIGDKNGNSYLASAYGGGIYLENRLYQYSDSVLTKFDVNGNVTWNRSFTASPDNVVFSDLAFSKSESINAVGYFLRTSGSSEGVDFDPMDGEVIRVPSGHSDGFLAEYTTDGLYSKVVTWGSSTMNYNDTVLANVIVSDDDHNIYILGDFLGEIDFDPGPASIKKTSAEGSSFISKFDSNFNFINVVQLPLLSSAAYSPGSIAVNRMGEIFIIGSFQGTVDFDPGPSVEERTSNGYYDIALLKLTKDMGFAWVRTWGGPSPDYGDYGFDIVCNQTNGALYIVGGFSNTIDFDPGDDVYQLTPLSGTDSFLMKILPNGYWE